MARAARLDARASKPKCADPNHHLEKAGLTAAPAILPAKAEKNRPAASPADLALERAELQPLLFADRPSRLDLAKVEVTWPLRDLVIRVHRNHSFEHSAQASLPWFAWWGKRPIFSYSGYDDSLAFALQEGERADAELVWIDASAYLKRMQADDLISWLSNRLQALRQMTDAPILVALISEEAGLDLRLRDACGAIPGLRVADSSEVSQPLGAKYLDLRAEKFSGTKLSDSASILFAREIACRWLPPLLQPRIKAIAVDLDHTLYQGVLGEDGIDVKLTPGHRQLQQTLVSLRESGLLLALISRNEAEDVRRLFKQRQDFPLRWEHFSSHKASWESKTAAIREAAGDFRVGLDAVLFVDDNPGELAAVASAVPQIHTLHACEDALLTDRCIRCFPGVWSWGKSSDDTIRARDVESIARREELQSQFSDPAEYLRSLRIVLRVEVTPRPRLQRLAELSQKTNQFNLNLARLTESQIAAMLDSDRHHVAAVSLEDRLSDSGMIALLAAERNGGDLVVDDLAISCRALGRQLETTIVAAAIAAMHRELPVKSVFFRHCTGPRNAPAREWLSGFTGAVLPDRGCQPAPAILDPSLLANCPARIEMPSHDER